MTKLEEYRKEIDQIDRQLIQLFEERMDITRKISEYKNEHHLPILNKDREEEVLKKNISCLQNKKYSQMAIEFFENIMKLSREYQQKLKR